MKRARVALLLLAAATGSAAAPAPAPLPPIEACLGRLDRALDVGFARIGAKCPELAPALRQSPYAPWLPGDWDRPDNQLSAEGLERLGELIARESTPAAAASTLHTERVAAVLERVVQASPDSGGWWTRFKHWLRELFTPHPEQHGLWPRLLGSGQLGEGVLRVLVWGSIALLIALAAGIIVNELRLAGVLRPRRRRAGDTGAGAAAQPAPVDLESAEPAARPQLLLQLIASRLAATDRLPPARAFTVRELTRRARLPSAADRARLGALADVCERLRFSGHGVAASEVAAALAGGEQLLLALGSPVRQAA